MRTQEAPVGDYLAKINIEDEVEKFFDFGIDMAKVAVLAEAMGVDEAIERRLHVNPNLPKNLVINYLGRNIGRSGQVKKPLGVAHAPRQRHKRMPPSDVDV